MSSAAHELEIYSTEKGLTAKQLLAFWKKVEAGPSVLPSSRPLPGKPIAAFNAPYWPTQALQTSQPRSASNVIWSVDHERYGAKGFPPNFELPFKRALFLLINTPMTDLLHRRRKTRKAAPDALSAGSIHGIARVWKAFAWYLHGRGVNTLAACGDQNGHSELLEGYARFLNARVRRGEIGERQQRTIQKSLTQLWACSHMLPPDDRLPKPLWVDEDFSQRPISSDENATAVIGAATMAPLWVMAYAFVKDFAGDILAARAEKSRLMAGIKDEPSKAGRKRARAILESTYQPGAAVHAKNQLGRVAIASSYIAAITGGVSAGQISQLFNGGGGGTGRRVDGLMRRRNLHLELHLPQPIEVQVTGRLGDQPWVDYIDFRKVDDYVEALQAAGLIVLAYLTGMRPHEILRLTSGCEGSIQAPDGTLIPVINGAITKGVTAQGRQSITGREHIWPAHAPATLAIGVLTRLHGDGLLFRNQAGVLMSTNQATEAVERFIPIANSISSALGLGASHHIPPDGTITLRRFRRTISWYIVNQPNGHLTAALKNGHLDPRTSMLYSGTKHSGLDSSIDKETSRAVAHTLDQLKEAVRQGSGISGPSAEQAAAAIRNAPVFGAQMLTKAQENLIKRNPQWQIFDNPRWYALCRFDREKSLCHNEKMRQRVNYPDTTNCQSGCRNLVYTDQSIATMTEAIAAMKETLPNLPEPLQLLVTEQIRTLTSRVATHRRTRVSVDLEMPTTAGKRPK
ncbi:MAG: hypothetical protein KDB71_15175 [Mycobacterium sp.]|nr:hypothetical protein [Mycobacterium sp.]